MKCPNSVSLLQHNVVDEQNTAVIKLIGVKWSQLLLYYY
jgi:hypothetical protein